MPNFLKKVYIQGLEFDSYICMQLYDVVVLYRRFRQMSYILYIGSIEYALSSNIDYVGQIWCNICHAITLHQGASSRQEAFLYSRNILLQSITVLFT